MPLTTLPSEWALQERFAAAMVAGMLAWGHQMRMQLYFMLYALCSKSLSPSLSLRIPPPAHIPTCIQVLRHPAAQDTARWPAGGRCILRVWPGGQQLHSLHVCAAGGEAALPGPRGPAGELFFCVAGMLHGFDGCVFWWGVGGAAGVSMGVLCLLFYRCGCLLLRATAGCWLNAAASSSLSLSCRLPVLLPTRLLCCKSAVLQFYPFGEADEVDGIEEGLEKWLDGLWPALRKAVQPAGAAAAPEAAAAPPAAAGAAQAAGGGEDGELKGVPPLARCRVRLEWQEGGAAEVVRAAEAGAPSQAELARRDPAGVYSAEAPFWAPLHDARYLTTELSGPDRQVRWLAGRTFAAAGTTAASCVGWKKSSLLFAAAAAASVAACAPSVSVEPPSSPGPALALLLQVLHLELNIFSSGMQYAPGDSIGVLPQNDPALVAALLERLGLEGDAVFSVVPAGKGQAVAVIGAAAAANGGAAHDSSREHLLPHLGAPCSVRAALSRGVDLTGPPRKSLLRLLAEHCGEATERRRLLHLCSRDGREEYATDMLAGRPSLLQLLRQFPSCRPPLDALLDALPPLAARMYSLSCSPLECPGKVGNLCCLPCPALPCLSLRFIMGATVGC